MAEPIHIQNGSFEAYIRPDQLAEIPRLKFRRLTKLLLNAYPRDQKTIDRLGAELRDQVLIARMSWLAAQSEYLVKKQTVKKSSRTLAALEKLKNNQRLKDTLAQTKQAYTAILTLQTIFNKECS